MTQNTGTIERGMYYIVGKLVDAGFTLKRSPHDQIYLANGAAGRFVVAVRAKKAPTYRRKTNVWEFGVDHQDLEHYTAVKAVYGLPLYVYFYSEDDRAATYVELDDVVAGARLWTDPVHFPEGIYFVPRYVTRGGGLPLIPTVVPGGAESPGISFSGCG